MNEKGREKTTLKHPRELWRGTKAWFMVPGNMERALGIEGQGRQEAIEKRVKALREALEKGSPTLPGHNHVIYSQDDYGEEAEK